MTGNPAGSGNPGNPAGCRCSEAATEPGTVTLWVLYWSLAVLFLAGFGVDLWRGVSVRRSLLEQAEAAAAAGANGVDEETFRQTGDVIIDPARADLLARQTLAAQGEVDLIDAAAVVIDGGAQEVTVELSGEVDFTLVKLFLSSEAPLTIEVAATAAPRIGEP